MTHVTNPMDYQLHVQGSACIIRLPVSFTVLKAAAFKKWFQTLPEQYPQTEQMVLDLSETTFIDSSGIGALVICRRLCQAHNSRLILRDVSAQVMMALSVTDLGQIFTIESSAPLQSKPISLPASSQLLATHPSVTSRAKRLMDIVGAIVGLGITAVLFVPIAIAIKLDNNGPIFFGQVRCSWMGKRFRIWKFRSMVTNAEALKHQVKNQLEGPLFKNENDPRITRVGRFLRKTSLDELPQFWNVLKGEMSLVGTRPPTPDELENYEVPEWQRLDVKPGMTGEWQVNGRSSIKKFEDVIRLDLRYQENWSLLYDVKLILKTVLVLFSKKAGAS
ncbi:sugar transferase [Almyronema epifaneia]|uniref:Sugar transferase n=1 Tax=Almyronema epifaneia S1 TaxID=2991925 RepID=A0ABW6IGS2_9CYAN